MSHAKEQEAAIQMIDVPKLDSMSNDDDSPSKLSATTVRALGPSEDSKGSSIFGASFNFINSIIGAGIIGLPFAFENTGIFMGTILLYLVAVLVQYGVAGLVQRGAKAKCDNYEELCEKIIGLTGSRVLVFFMFLFAYGAMIAYLMVIGDTVPKVFTEIDAESILANRTWVILLFACLFILPLCLLKDMSSLANTSVLSIVSVVVIVITVAIRGPAAAKEQGINATNESNPYAFVRSELFAGLGGMSFAFVCHHSSFMVYNSLKVKTLENWNKVTRIAVWTSFVLSLALALFGYLNFFSHTQSDILDNFSVDDTAINVSRMLLSFTMVFTYPMEQFVARHCVLTLLFSENFNNYHFYTVTIVLWAVTVIVGITVEDLGIVFEIVGAVAASTLGFTFPALIFFMEADTPPVDQFWNMINVWRKGSDVFKSSVKERFVYFTRFWAPLVMLVFGIMAMVYGTVSASLSA